jgi:Phosphomevalonate kinase
MILIGISGKKQSGKNTVAQMISEITKLKVVELAFADELKRELAEACQVTTDYIEANKGNFRLGLQWWGTEFRRKLSGENYWVGRLGNRVLRLPATTKVCIVTDMRFPNEYDFISACGGTTIRVNRGGLPPDNHPSEVSLDGYKFDITINNDSTMDDLKVRVMAICTSLNLI